MDQQGTKHYSGGHIARNAQGHHRDQGTAFHGVIRAFRCDDSVGNTGAEFLGVLGYLLGLVVGKNIGDRSAGSRQNAGKHPDQS